MKNKTIIILILIITASLIGNIFFLNQDIFDGTYYGKWEDGRNFTFSVDGHIVICKLYEEDGTLDRKWVCYYEIEDPKEIEDKSKKPEIMIYYIHDRFPLERVYRNSIFAMPDWGETSVYVCPMAIAIQSIWAIADIVLLVFIIKELKKVLKLPKLRIVVEKNG